MATGQRDDDDSVPKRDAIVERQIARRGITDPRLLGAMRRVPREEFIPRRLREFAYEDTALPIASAQTISQPYIVALMLDALELEDSARVLDVGTGSGYAAAILGEMVERVYSIERIEELADSAGHVLKELGYENVEVIQGDGSEGWPEAQPYDGIVVAAGGPDVPEALKRQLKVGGHLVIPIGEAGVQQLVRITRLSEGEFESRQLGAVRFVPLIGEAAWDEGGHRRKPTARSEGGGDDRDSETQKLLAANAEEYYRSLYEGYADSWNLRDTHMFDTLNSLLDHRGENARIVVWAHNSHLGNAAATEMSARGQHNVGQLCRQAFGDDVYLIGMGTHSGTVAAADDWGDPMKVMKVEPSLAGSWERAWHDTGIPAFTGPVRRHAPAARRERLTEERLERAIGVIYRPRSERASHYFHARLGDQFDEYVWFEESTAVTPLGFRELEGMPDSYPFGL